MKLSTADIDQQIAEELSLSISTMSRGQARTGQMSGPALQYQRRAALEAMRRVQCETHSRIRPASRCLGRRIEIARGFGHVHTGGDGEGVALARTGRDSFGSAVSCVEGPGLSMAVVSEEACGSANAWTAYAGKSIARVQAGATGDADACCYGSGRAEARVASGTSGSAYARSRGEGAALAHSRAGGRVFAECIGPGRIVVDQWSEADFEVVQRCCRRFKIIHFCSIQTSAEISDDGTLHLYYGRMCHVSRPIPPQSQVIAIHSPAEIDFQ